MELAGPPDLKRLGKNHNGYFGETIQLEVLLGECLAAAHAHGWRVEEILPGPPPLLGFSRPASQPKARPLPRVYISTGIHGDEPAGPLAVRQLLQENQWPAGLELWLCPCLNPAGFRLNRRENAQGLDLNRQYLTPQAPEILAHTAWLRRQPGFDLCLCLHEDWESHGFYVYELNPEELPSLAEGMVASVAKVCPIDLSDTIEGRPAQRGVIRPSVDPRARPDWPESFFLLTYKTQLSYTLEAPSDFPLAARVAALVSGVRAALAGLLGPERGA